MGDYNEVQNDLERIGSQFHQNSTRIFNDFIEQANLTDIPLGGPHFTWSDKWGSKFSKLDRFFILDGFLDSFLTFRV